jgi:hypothetical protein
MKLDDPFNGDWTTVKASMTVDQAEARFDFAPLVQSEAPGISIEAAVHRLTYKLRLLAAEPLAVRKVGVYSDAVERRARLRFEWGVRTVTPGPVGAEVRGRNGRVIAIERQGADAAVVEVAYADAPERLSPDRGYLLFRSGETRSFAVFIDDVLREGGCWCVTSACSSAMPTGTSPTRHGRDRRARFGPRARWSNRSRAVPSRASIR